MPAANEPNDLASVVEDFRSAEKALNDVLAERDRLKRAADHFVSAETKSTKRTRDSLEALEAVREQLRQQMELSADWTNQSANTEKAIAAALQKMAAVLDALRKIKPEAMVENLASMEKSHNDNAAELREVRRLVADLERASRELTSAHQKLTSGVESATGELKSEQGKIVASLKQVTRDLQEGQTVAIARLNRMIGVQVLTLAAAVAALVAALR